MQLLEVNNLQKYKHINFMKCAPSCRFSMCPLNDVTCRVFKDYHLLYQERNADLTYMRFCACGPQAQLSKKRLCDNLSVSLTALSNSLKENIVVSKYRSYLQKDRYVVHIEISLEK